MLIDSPPELIASFNAAPGLKVSWLASAELIQRQREMGWPGTAYPYTSQRAKVDPRGIHAVRRAVAAERPHLIHAFYGRALAHAVWAVTGVRARPKIVSFRGITSRLNRLDLGDWVSYLHPFVDAHACESQAVRQALIDSRVPAERCFTTYNFSRVTARTTAERHTLLPAEIPRHAFVAGMVANMRPVKGADILLEAFHQLLDLHHVHLILVGEIRDQRLSQMLIDPRLHGRVHAVGYRTDATAIMSALDLFVMPSRNEALCRALLEAMAQGVCPVVSDAGGMPELVRHNQDGLVVERENPTALANAIRKLVGDNNLRQSLAKSSAARLANNFSADQWCSRLQTCYQQIVAGRELPPHILCATEQTAMDDYPFKIPKAA